MVNKNAPFAAPGSSTIVEAFVPTGTADAFQWEHLHGVMSGDFNNGERPINEAETLDGTFIEEGEKTKPSLTLDMSTIMQTLPVYLALVDIFNGPNPLVNIRWRTPSREFIPLTTGNTNNLSVSTAGVATFPNATDNEKLLLGSDRVRIGMCLTTGTTGSFQDYQIVNKQIDANGQIVNFTVTDATANTRNVASAISDLNYAVRLPQVEQPEITFTLSSAGNETWSSGQVGIGSVLELRATHDRLPKRFNSNP